MKINMGKLKLSALALAVQGALAALSAMPAHAADDEATLLKTPSNFMEIGGTNTSASSAKFGEYGGLNKSGADAVGNFSVRGGDSYGAAEGTTRWAITGSDLGLTSRSVDAAVSNQGQWSVGVGYDELRHNISDSYQTPYNGNMGGNSFTLPAGFGLVTASPSTVPGTNSLTAGQLSAMHNLDIATTRKNTSFSAGYTFNSAWDLKFDFNHLDQSGAKLMGFGSMLQTGVTGEAVSILPNPTNYKTETFNVALNWMGEKGHMTGSYYGSFFHDNYDRVTFDTFAGTASANQLMSTAPSNDFHQLNLLGGYSFSPKTKLNGSLSYGRNTQNDAYVTDAVSMVTVPPKNSLEGLVVNTHADLKLTDQTTNNLALSAGIKYDERNDRTESYLYKFNALDGAANHVAYFPNTPYSNNKAQVELAGDYRISRNQHARLAYNREDIKRWCEQYAVGGSGAYVAGQNYNNYPAGTNCVVAYASKEDKLSAVYRLNATDDLNMNFAYVYSKRLTDSDPNAITARIGTNGNVDPAAPAATLVWGQNAGDYRGFYPFFSASRTEKMFKAGANWQATEKFSVALNGRYTDDVYDVTYGVQNGNKWSAGLDASYSYSENGAMTGYVTQQHRQRDLTDLQRAPTLAPSPATTNAIAIPAGATWTDKLRDDDFTLGLGVKQNGLLGGKLELLGDVSYSLANTGYGTQLNYSTTTSGGLTCSAPQILSCGDLPDIKTTVIQLKLIGNYTIDKSAKVSLGYLYQYMESADYYYNGLQYGYTPNALMPTNQQSPNYSVNVVAASYSYLFR